jgi:hypothetical protein
VKVSEGQAIGFFEVMFKLKSSLIYQTEKSVVQHDAYFIRRANWQRILTAIE